MSKIHRAGTALFAALLIGLPSSLAAQQPTEVLDLLRQYNTENGNCRGGRGDDPQTFAACKRRDVISDRLSAHGLCYGVFSYGYNSEWEPCSPTDNQPVFVKSIYMGTGPMRITGFECRMVTKSSFIERVCHNHDNDVMLVKIRNTYYRYCDVDNMFVREFFAAPSMGRFFNQRVKGVLDC